jgi:hypothetical protein
MPYALLGGWLKGAADTALKNFALSAGRKLKFVDQRHPHLRCHQKPAIAMGSDPSTQLHPSPVRLRPPDLH